MEAKRKVRVSGGHPRREAGGVRVRKMLAVGELTIRDVEKKEVEQVRYLRGRCQSCSHTWRPRNPSRGVNRCPGCGVRRRVQYTALRDPSKGEPPPPPVTSMFDPITAARVLKNYDERFYVPLDPLD